jgi:hypothetical protein
MPANRRWFGLRSKSIDDTHDKGQTAWESAREGWSNIASDATDRVREASRSLPDVHLPEVRLPDVNLRDVHMPEIHLPQLRRKQPWYRRTGPVLGVAGVAAVGGATIAYFFDPDRGRARRAQTIDRLAGTARKTADRAGRVGRKLSSDASGWTSRVAAIPARSKKEPLDDATLAHKVETELFRDPEILKGDINVNAENGIVVVRGQVPSWDVATQIESRVRKIDGVKEVQNLLHEPTQPAPTDTFPAETPKESTPTNA